jgi:hypothetical protein
LAEAVENKAEKAAPMDRLWADNDESRASDDPALVVDVAGFEGPLDLLLHLARNQKVDLARISVLALAEQYLVFIESARKLRLELAADYLVMAAWLAYLKSRLMVPQAPSDEEPSGEMLAALLQREARALARAYVEGYHAALADRVSVRWIIESEKIEPTSSGAAEFHTLSGCSRAVHWLAGPLLSSSSCGKAPALEKRLSDMKCHVNS